MDQQGVESLGYLSIRQINFFKNVNDSFAIHIFQTEAFTIYEGTLFSFRQGKL